MNRDYRDPNMPWNPVKPVDITPIEFENLVSSWVRACARIQNTEVIQQAKVEGISGDFAIDILVQLIVLGEASINILIECKHQARPVERDEIIILEGKLRDTGAHKGMLFSTSGFQKGAIDYATRHGIATISVIKGEWLFETRDLGPRRPPPPWLNLPTLAGQYLSSNDRGISVHTIVPNSMDAIKAFLRA